MAKRKKVKLTEDEYEYLCACELDYKYAVQEVVREMLKDIKEIAYKNEEGDLYLDRADFAEFEKKYAEK